MGRYYHGPGREIFKNLTKVLYRLYGCSEHSRLLEGRGEREAVVGSRAKEIAKQESDPEGLCNTQNY